MIYYVAALIICLVFLSVAVDSFASHEILKTHEQIAPNDTVIRVFNSNTWRKINEEQSTERNKKTRFHSNSTWSSNFTGDPYFDGYLGRHPVVDKAGLFKALRKILDKKPAKIKDSDPGSKDNVCKLHRKGILFSGKPVKGKLLSFKKPELTTIKTSQSQCCEKNVTAIDPFFNFNKASQRLETIADKMEGELKNLSKIRISMERSVCRHRAVKVEEKQKKWGEWSSWSACSVTCGVGSQVRDRVANNPERGRPSVEIEVKPCRLPDCNPTTYLFCSANNLLKSIIPMRNTTC